MKLQFLARTFEHFSCAGINLTKDQSHDFPEELGARILHDYAQDFVVSGDEAPVRKVPKIRKPIMAKSNKVIKKCSSCKAQG